MLDNISDEGQLCVKCLIEVKECSLPPDMHNLFLFCCGMQTNPIYKPDQIYTHLQYITVSIYYCMNFYLCCVKHNNLSIYYF